MQQNALMDANSKRRIFLRSTLFLSLRAQTKIADAEGTGFGETAANLLCREAARGHKIVRQWHDWGAGFDYAFRQNADLRE